MKNTSSTQYMGARPDKVNTSKELSGAKPRRTVKRGDWMSMEKQFIKETAPIVYWREEFYGWPGHWIKASDDDLKAVLYKWLDTKQIEYHVEEKDGKISKQTAPFKPKKKDVQELLSALAATAHLQDYHEPPCWQDSSGSPDPKDLLLFQNGILNLQTGEFAEPDPALFCLSRVECEYDPRAKASAWDGFLNGLFPDEPETRELIEEMLGYSMGFDRSQHKVFMLLGPPRSGKGTIGRILKQLVGPNQYVGPTVASFSSQFGMQQLIGKSVACVADARSGRGHDPFLVVERLLTISGQDHQTIDRKWKGHWNGTLPTQIWWMSNEEPKLADASGAIATRLILIRLTQSFLGREDPELTDKLLAELPGIANRALAGLRRLRERGHFIQPASSAETLRQIERDANTVRAWLDDCCELRPEAETSREDAYRNYADWCSFYGYRVPNERTFGKDLRSATSKVRRGRASKPNAQGKRPTLYKGMALVDDHHMRGL